MNFNAASYFAGVGTVLATLVVGFGGGVLMSGVLSDDKPREPNKIERRAEPAPPPAIAPTPVTVAPQPAAVPQTAVAASAPAASAPQEPQATPAQDGPSFAPGVAAPAPNAEPAQVPPAAHAAGAPELGPQKNVSLTRPGSQETLRVPQEANSEPLSRAERRKLERKQRRAEREQLREQRRLEREQRRAEKRQRHEEIRQERQASASRRPDRREIDEEDDELPFAARREHAFEPPRLPFFRLFGSN
jgi:hypothetical protein